MATKLNYNFNHHNPNLGYYILKSINKVDEKSKRILINIKDSIFDFENKTYSDIYSFLTEYYRNKLNIKSDSPDLITIKDFLKMKDKYDNKKIPLTYKSINRIRNEHDKLSLLIISKRIHLKNVKKNSKFNNLEKILPKEFEWIKTGKRLAIEAKKMKHCVANYSDDIERDRCAIYSFIFEDNKRYTIEFRYTHKKYVIRQVYGKRNHFNQNAYDYVQNILSNVQK